MASLKSLLATKSDAFATPEEEQNLEKGRIYTYNPGTNYSRLWCCFCFHPEESGIAVVDIWGAGGSGAEMCCCGFGLAGNSGAYTRRTVVMVLEITLKVELVLLVVMLIAFVLEDVPSNLCKILYIRNLYVYLDRRWKRRNFLLFY